MLSLRESVSVDTPSKSVVGLKDFVGQTRDVESIEDHSDVQA